VEQEQANVSIQQTQLLVLMDIIYKLQHASQLLLEPKKQVIQYLLLVYQDISLKIPLHVLFAKMELINVLQLPLLQVV